MPPKAKITKEMVLDAAFAIARESGGDAINARAVAERLGCSTQPVMYHFATMESLRQAVYQKADAFHSAYLMNLSGADPMKEIGMNYIRFAFEEKPLFRLLFQSDGLPGSSISALMEEEALLPVLMVLMEEAGLDLQQAKTVFRSLFLMAHGYASLFACNALDYDPDVVSADLELIFQGSISALKGGLS